MKKSELKKTLNTCCIDPKVPADRLLIDVNNPDYYFEEAIRNIKTAQLENISKSEANKGFDTLRSNLAKQNEKDAITRAVKCLNVLLQTI